MLRLALAEVNGSLSLAARLLSISRPTLAYRLRKHKIAVERPEAQYNFRRASKARDEKRDFHRAISHTGVTATRSVRLRATLSTRRAMER